MKNELTREDIKYIVKRVLRNYQMQGRDSAARAVATEIYDAIERTYSMNVEWNIANNFPPALEPTVKRLEKGLGILLKRTEPSAKIYEWIAEQEKQGKKIEKFTTWATQPERAQYLPKYFSKPEYLQVDYQQAFLEVYGDRPEYQPFKTDEDKGEYVPAPRN